jgi:hypothetical protein
LDYLQDKWGDVSIKYIAKKLDRSISSVKEKANKSGLGDATLSFEGITLVKLARELGISLTTVKNWIAQHDFPSIEKVFAVKSQVKVVKYDAFWKWAETHKQLVNLGRLEPLVLGPEPKWAKVKRSADLINVEKKKKRAWSVEDDNRLKGMLKAYCYTYPEISERLQRSEAAIKRRMLDLNLKERPVRLNNQIKYTEDEVQELIDLYHNGFGFNTIAKKLNKSAIGVRGKLERMGYKFHNGLPTLERKAD